MKENAHNLETIIARRQLVEDEIARIESLGTQFAADKDLLLDDADALGNESKVLSLSQLDARIAFVGPRLARLRADLATVDDELNIAVDAAFTAFHGAITALEQRRQQSFCEGIAGHFEGGLSHPYFQKYPHAPRPIAARVAFEESTSYTSLIGLRHAIGGADKAFSKQPALGRAKVILDAVHRLPAS